jgi:hypothetical protein
VSVLGRSAWYLTGGAGGPVTFNYTISGSGGGVDARSGAISAGWNGSDPLTITVNSGVVLKGSAGGSYGLLISGSFPGGVTLVNNGVICGDWAAGGSGGYGVVGSWGSSGGDGTAGGQGLYVNITAGGPLKGYNYGVIAGASGGGGGGGSSNNNTSTATNAGGNGGNGMNYYQSYGTGSAGQAYGDGTYGGTGGNGGSAYGDAGSAGQQGTGNYWTNGGNGGAVGSAIVGYSQITVYATGTVLGNVTG